MAKVLITAGNVFEPTFDGVCYAANKLINGITAIHIFDTDESTKQAQTSQRDSRIRALLGPIDISTSLINDETLQTVVPDRIARLIREYGINDIIIDLSNGQKITIAVLYAVSALSRIANIYSLSFFTRVNKETKLSDLNYPSEWDYTQIKPLKEILNITQSSYVELIYYRDRIESITAAIEARNHTLATDIRDKLEHSLIDYFTLSALNASSPERLERCVNGLGKICEEIAGLWHNYCVHKKLITSSANNFASRSKQIIQRWDKYRSDMAGGKLNLSDETVVQSVIPTLVIDSQLEAMRIYRNLASHSERHYVYSQHDARLALHLTLSILERISSSNIIQAEIKESYDD